jgi:hypothetical protein
VEQLALAGRRAAAVRSLLAELPFMDAAANDGLGGGAGDGRTGDASSSSSGSLKQASQEDLLRELGLRLGAGSDDPAAAVERLAVAAGFTKRGSAADVYSGSAAGRASQSDKEVRFSLRCEGLSTAGFGAAQQQGLEKLLAKGYGLKGSGKESGGDAKISVVGFGVGGAYAGSTGVGSGGAGYGGEGGTCVVVDCRATGFKTAQAAAKFAAGARAAAVPVGSERAFGRVTFEKPPCVCAGDGDGGDDGPRRGVPGAPTVAAASAGDGEAKVLVVPPTRADGSGAYDASVLEIEVVANPGRLRGSAPVGEPVVVRGLANGTK